MMRYKDNPCNLRWSARNSWLGQIEPKNGFCQFENVEFGLRATLRTLQTYRKRGKRTILQIIRTFAPPTENATDFYVDFVCSYLTTYLSELSLFDGVEDFYPNTVLSKRVEYAVLVSAMCKIETQFIISYKDVLAIMVKYNIFKQLS